MSLKLLRKANLLCSFQRCPVRTWRKNLFYRGVWAGKGVSLFSDQVSKGFRKYSPLIQCRKLGLLLYYLLLRLPNSEKDVCVRLLWDEVQCWVTAVWREAVLHPVSLWRRRAIVMSLNISTQIFTTWAKCEAKLPSDCLAQMQGFD